MDYTYTEQALLEGNLSSLMDMRIKEAEDICESLCWRILDVSAFINNSGEKAEIQNAEQDLSDYKTMLVNAQELVDLLREQKKKKKKTNRKDWEEDLDEEFPQADDSLYIEKLKQRMEESSEDDFDYLDLAARLAEFEDECEEREKEYLSLDISEPEPKKKPKTSRFFKNLKSLVLD